jgi:hypothetical protein
MNIFQYKDILYYIKSFLSNEDIIELILCSKEINNMIGRTNTFTSITLTKDQNICTMIKLYLKHKKSIYKTILKNIKDTYNLWPFGTYYMSFIKCDVHKEEIYKNYKEAKEIYIEENKLPRFWH